MLKLYNFWIFFLLCKNCAIALNNGLARSPPMGWMSWGRYRCNTDCKTYPSECISEDLFKRIAKEFVSGGYADAGYEYIIIDDCWMEKKRNHFGQLIPDHSRFPGGMKSLSKYIHSLGLKFGIYENYGELTCEQYPGSIKHVEDDTRLFAEWEADYVKLDGCFTESNLLDFGYPKFGHALNNTKRPMVFSCSWPYYQEHIIGIMPNYKEIQKTCNLWRNYHDIESSWESLKNTILYYGSNHERMASYAGPGHWNDPDMLMIGNPGLNVGQCRIQMAIWAILAAPLIMSNDLPNIPEEMKEILLNLEVIAVNQDPLGLQGGMTRDTHGDLKIWYKKVLPVKYDHCSYVLAFVNMNSFVEQAVAVLLSSLGLNYPDEYNLQDLFASKVISNVTSNDRLTVTVKPMDVIFYKFTVL